MYVYLKKGAPLDEAVQILDKIEACKHEYRGMTVWDFDSAPRVDFKGPIDLAQSAVEELLFVKATVLETQKRMNGPRECGIYKLGTASAELTRGLESNVCVLLMETSSYTDGFSDMKTLREMVWAGTIAPKLSYDSKQGEQSLMNILRYLVGMEKLSFWKRFKLCWKASLAQ